MCTSKTRRMVSEPKSPLERDLPRSIGPHLKSSKILTVEPERFVCFLKRYATLFQLRKLCADMGLKFCRRSRMFFLDFLYEILFVSPLRYSWDFFSILWILFETKIYIWYSLERSRRESYVPFPGAEPNMDTSFCNTVLVQKRLNHQYQLLVYWMKQYLQCEGYQIWTIKGIVSHQGFTSKLSYLV